MLQFLDRGQLENKVAPQQAQSEPLPSSDAIDSTRPTTPDQSSTPATSKVAELIHLPPGDMPLDEPPPMNIPNPKLPFRPTFPSHITDQVRSSEADDLLPRIQNMYRLLDLYSESGSGGLGE